MHEAIRLMLGTDRLKSREETASASVFSPPPASLPGFTGREPKLASPALINSNRGYQAPYINKPEASEDHPEEPDLSPEELLDAEPIHLDDVRAARAEHFRQTQSDDYGETETFETANGYSVKPRLPKASIDDLLLHRRLERKRQEQARKQSPDPVSTHRRGVRELLDARRSNMEQGGTKAATKAARDSATGP